MHTALIGEGMGPFQELSEYQHETVIGCHLCNQSSREIFSLLNIQQSAFSGIKTKWKQLGTTVVQSKLNNSNPVKSLPRRLEALIAANCGQTDHIKLYGLRDATQVHGL